MANNECGMKKYTVLTMPIYRTKIYVMDIANPLSVLAKAGLKTELFDHAPTDNTIADCQVIHKKSGACAVLMRLSKDYEETTVWHESIHCAAMILDEICGIDYTDSYAEVLAYSVEWIVKMIKQDFYGIKVNFDD